MKSSLEIKKIVSQIRVFDGPDIYKTDLFASIRKVESIRNCIISLETFDTDNFGSFSGFLGLSGQVVRTASNKYKIFTNPFDGAQRQRFTIAHELGHIVLEHLEVEDNLKEPTLNILNREIEFDSSSYQEKEANKFAAELLMPEEDFVNFFKINSNGSITTHVDMELIEKGAAVFDVSQSAIMTRLNFLKFKFL